ncbi:hypothetical protein ACRDU6_30070 [Mycolicibacterium sp. ELW1]|uniref:hypothetical protein n=1 Tax=Mycobacteriaceae TaxID=1762 RepID=UPI0011F07F3A|nr:hypothetical protein [Mycobacterium sp. ELW1]QEN16376.1 hypothetical protein D3H54_26595 [Mycobacterium sp. ELW1]
MISLKVWHIPSGVAGIQERTAAAFNACRKAFPSYFPDEAADLDPGELSVDIETSVVEVSVSVYSENVPTSQLAELFEDGVAHIQRLQRAQGYVTGHPVRPISIQTLPPQIPMATGSVGTSGLRTDGGINLYLLEQNIWQYGTHTDFDELQLRKFQSFVFRDSGVFSGFLSSSSDARSALIHRGDARSSLLASATACEVLLDDFFKHLLWESAARPEDCVKFFVDRQRMSPVLSRVRRHLGDLIGGDWNPSTQPVLRAWQESIAYGRNRTIHAGYSPTSKEAQAALDTTDELHSFCMHALAEEKSKYPKTALMGIGVQILQDQGLMTPQIQSELENGDPEDWQARFKRWRTALDRLTEHALGRSTLDASAAISIAVIDAPGHARWVRHLRQAGFAAN